MFTNRRVFVVGSFSLFLLAALLGRQQVQAIGETALFLVSPTAERAYEYGARHFDAIHARDYDMDRAVFFFKEAEKIDADYPYLQHQLARISFLKGDFANALRRIDREIENNPSPSLSSFYVRGLVKGFAGDYLGAIPDYQKFLESEPANWAASNDLAWVYLKANRPSEALVAIDAALSANIGNPWLLNSRATALFELGRLEEARDAARLSLYAVKGITKEDWLKAYPGNDPLIAPEGMHAFQSAVLANMHSILIAMEKEQKGVR
ncbi:tetratricopeptide repeat protein [Candidatus Kaiserbacteria bacterium]|nr:tetratricopeptide repeat protein [Candidatus Kaiserbacteria bacterium]